MLSSNTARRRAGAPLELVAQPHIWRREPKSQPRGSRPRELPVRKFRRPFLDERRHAFLLVLGRKQRVEKPTLE